MKPSLLRNYLFLSLGVTILFVLLGLFTLQIFRQINLSKFENNPPLFFAQFVDEAKPEDRVKFFDRVKNQNFPFDVWLFSEEGKVEGSSTHAVLPIDVSKTKLPQEPLVADNLSSFWHLGPPTMVMRLHGQPVLYLVFSPRPFSEIDRDRDHASPSDEPPGPPPGFDSRAPHEGGGPFPGRPPGPPPPGPHRGPHGPTPFLPIAIFVIAMLLASGVSVLILFIYIKKTSLLADTVLEDLKRGNLHARFPVTKMNEVGNLMLRFNLMAEEIEKLFNQLKQKEELRARVLQELAHDLRTPVASMQNMLGLLLSGGEGVSAANKNEMLAMSHRESLYIGQLINDLLLLSQITGPESLAQKKVKTDLVPLIDSEVEAVEAQNLVQGEKIEMVNETQGLSLPFPCEPHLMRRLFRNLLDNGFSFAKTKITLSAHDIGSSFEILVEDDGPGFSSEALKSYGERKITRIVEPNTEGRISVGLGSVIIKAIAHFHNAEVIPGNVIGSSGEVLGARIIIRFPKA